MGISKQAVSKLVDVLVTEGFVDRKPNDADRRRTDLLLSAKGRRAADVIGDAVQATEDTFVRELGPERFADLVEMLAQLAQSRPGLRQRRPGPRGNHPNNRYEVSLLPP